MTLRSASLAALAAAGLLGSLGSASATPPFSVVSSVTSAAITASSRMGRMGSSAKDRMFMKKAAQGGMAEVEHGRLAAQKGRSEAVRRFGRRMVEDHSKANAELMRLAEQERVRLPAGMGPKHHAMHTRLSRLSGSAFDRMYMMHMVQDHVKDVSDFRRTARNGSDASVRRFASRTLPTLESHLQMAREVNRQVR